MKKRKILYLGINSSYSHSSLAYGYIKNFTLNQLSTPEDWQWQLHEATINDDVLTICQAIHRELPDILITTFYLFNHEPLLSILKRYHIIAPETLIIAGGPEFLGNNNSWLRQNREITCCIRGDESSFYQLLTSLHTPEAWNAIPGLCFIDSHNQYIDNGTAFIADNCSLPSPYVPELFRIERPFFQLETSRGCRGKCTFCTSSLSAHTRSYSLEQIEQHLDELTRMGIYDIRVLDRTFNESSDKTQALLDLFTTKFQKTRFHLEVNPALLTTAIVNKLRQADPQQFHIEAGIQSLNDSVLKAIKRPGNANKTLKGLKQLCRSTSIDIHVDLIAGLPRQRIQDVISDISQLINCYPEEIQLENLKLLPGTAIQQEIKKYNLCASPKPPYEIIKTSTMSLEDTQQARILSTLLESYYNNSKLRALFTFAVINNSDFMVNFLDFYSSQPELFMRKSLKKRFLILEKFFMQYGSEELKELFKFTWLASGFAIEKYNIKARKCSLNFKPEKAIWQDPSNRPCKRYFSETFAFKAAEIWITPRASLKKELTTYTFYQAMGNVMAEIKAGPHES